MLYIYSLMRFGVVGWGVVHRVSALGFKIGIYRAIGPKFQFARDLMAGERGCFIAKVEEGFCCESGNSEVMGDERKLIKGQVQRASSY